MPSIDIDRIIDNAQQATVPHQLVDGEIYAVRMDGGGVELLETTGYQRAAETVRLQEAPARIQRSVVVRDAESLINYLAANTDADDPADVGMGHRHNAAGDLEVWADVDRRTIKAILDGGPGHRVHSATLELRHSREWEEWAQVDGKLFDQVTFAQFIEDHLSSIGAPDGAQLLDIVQTLEAKTDVRFRSSQLLANGQRQLAFEETVDAKAGSKGDLKVPSELTLVLRPFQGSEPVAIVARFRFRISDGVLRMGVKLNEPDKALEEAFTQIVDAVQAEVPVRINHGIG